MCQHDSIRSRRRFITALAVSGLMVAPQCVAIGQGFGNQGIENGKPKGGPVSGEDAFEDAPAFTPKTRAQLKRSLSSIQYKVTQEEGTEPAFANKYWNNKKAGIYSCLICGLPLFESKTKFESGTGWPSFYAPLYEKHLGTKVDHKMQYPRTEVHCKRCGAHLGHVFNDGPQETVCVSA